MKKTTNMTEISMDRRWEDLPHELLDLIFVRLRTDELLKASLCCGNWYRASKNPDFWKFLDFSGYKPNPSDFNYVKHRKFSQILHYSAVVRSGGSATAVYFPDSLSRVGDEFFSIASWCPDLQFFSLTMGKLMYRQLANNVCAAISKLKHLRGMTVDAVFIKNIYSASTIVPYCTEFSHLKIKDLLLLGVEANAICFLSHQLKTLDLSYSAIPSWSLLRKILSCCKQLSSLDISNSEVSLIGCEEFCREASLMLKDFRRENLVFIYPGIRALKYKNCGYRSVN